jgi:hypothetical protein
MIKEMTIDDLARDLETPAFAALASNNPQLKKAAVVLCALLGAITDGVDEPTLDALSLIAGAICDHQCGHHV